MENKITKNISIIALLVAVLCLSIGFAAYSGTLKIQHRPSVPNQNTFKVRFSTSEMVTTEGVVNVTESKNSKASEAFIDNDNTEVLNKCESALVVPKIKGLNATFTSPGSVTYSFFIRNDGEFTAYLKAIIFDKKRCKISSDIKYSESVCDYLNIKVNIEDNIYTKTDNLIVNQSIEPGGSVPITVTITYDQNSKLSKEDTLEVDFGEISLIYSTIK